jgi:peptidoglycan/xylan/chitin deacetylase (PgdA/CDA1 family)
MCFGLQEKKISIYLGAVFLRIVIVVIDQVKNMDMKNKFLAIISIFVLNIFSAHGEIKMVFRYDDFLLMPSKLNDSILYIFQKNNIPLCIGIIPFDNANSVINSFNQDQINDLISRIQRKEIEVALHGYNHNNNANVSFFTKYASSEFATLRYDDQIEKLEKGKRYLDSLLQIDLKVFIPPFNTYDKTTLKALENLHFDIISANTKGPDGSCKIQYIPGTFVDFVNLPKIIEANKNSEVAIIVYFHPFSFPGGSANYPNDFTKQITMNQLNNLLHWLRQDGISFYTFSDIAKDADFSKKIYQENTAQFNILKKTLFKVKNYNYGVYSISKNARQKLEFFVGNILLHLFSFLFVYFFVVYFCRIFHPNLTLIKTGLAVISISGLIFFYYHRMDFSFWILFILFLVIYIALIMGVIRAYKPLIHSSKKPV